MVHGSRGGGLGDEGAELHAVHAEGGRLGVDLRSPYMLGRGLGEVAVDDRVAVEANYGRQPSGDRLTGQSPTKPISSRRFARASARHVPLSDGRGVSGDGERPPHNAPTPSHLCVPVRRLGDHDA
ncbi:MAG: hypothetical protein LC674_01180, partial [Actinobacteria bacterium]|nr:hypothetical protein [Actinomycetota bacterium]